MIFRVRDILVHEVQPSVGSNTRHVRNVSLLVLQILGHTLGWASSANISLTFRTVLSWLSNIIDKYMWKKHNKKNIPHEVLLRVFPEIGRAHV